jgi:hypothetical protein
MSEKAGMPKMLMVGGTGRSGTSIIKEIIARHPQAASLPFEYRFIIDPDGLVDFYASYSAAWSPYLADRRLRRLERFLNRLAGEPVHHRLAGDLIQWCNPGGRLCSPRAYHGWELSRYLPGFDHHVETLMSNLIESSFAACWVGTESYKLSPEIYHAPPRSREELAEILGDFIRRVVQDFLEQTGKTFFVEDNTWNILFAKEILELLPSAKIIHVYRDPRDVVASFAHQRWSPTDKEQGAVWYRTLMRHWFTVRSALSPEDYYELSLENLVSDPESVTRGICDFAGIEFHGSMLQVDLSGSHSGRWHREYDEEEKVQVEDILGDIIAELGYK